MSHLTWRLALAAVLACLHISSPHANSEGSVSTASQEAPAAPSDSPQPRDEKNQGIQNLPQKASTSAESKLLAPATPGLDDFGRLLGYVTLLAAAAGAAIYLIKFGIPLQFNRSKDQRKLQVLEMRPLGNRQFLIVVAYEDTRMLLGVTPGKIDYLCPLDSLSTTSKDFAQMVEKSEKRGATQ